MTFDISNYTTGLSDPTFIIVKSSEMTGGYLAPVMLVLMFIISVKMYLDRGRPIGSAMLHSSFWNIISAVLLSALGILDYIGLSVSMMLLFVSIVVSKVR